MDIKSAYTRVRQFVDARKSLRGMDPNEVSVVNPGSEKQAALTIADLEMLLAAVDAATDAEVTPAESDLLATLNALTRVKTGV